MIHVEGLTKRFGERVLLEDVSWHVKKRDRIGLSGPNGSGKTTLLKMLAGMEEPDEGSIRMASDTTIGYLPQDGIVHKGRTLIEELTLAFTELLKLKAELHDIEDKLAHDDDTGAAHEKLLERYSEIQERFKHLGGYEMDGAIADVMRGLGFKPEEQSRRCEEFSGGWQMRIALGKLLLARPNLLLMDEPTNHLDLPARNWLEEYLEDYPGSVVLVSHDRYFLDSTVKRITEVGLRTLTDYHGNYSHYVTAHTAAMDRLREAHRRQSEEIEKTQAFINRFRYTATKARQVQSRIKLLDKVERIEIPPERKKIRFHFPDAPRPGRVLMELKGLRKAYGANVVLNGIDLHIERGDRLALVGPNGAGKSTLMRVIAGVDHFDSGERIEGHKVVLDYFAQDQAAVLNPSRTIYEEMSSGSPTTMVPMIRTILGGFLFSGDDAYKKVAVLSGGERNRVALARMLLNPSNLLVLDEPTNHLDLDSKEVLLDALLDYTGTIVFVSHDRYFVDRLANKVVEVGGGQALFYPGGYEDFLYFKKQRAAGLDVALPKAPVPAPEKTERHAAAPPTPAAKPKTEAAPAAKAPAHAASAKGKPAKAEAAKPSYDPLAPRLRTKEAAPDRAAEERERKQREREAKKREQRVKELEARIAATETAVKALEAAMAAPGFYDDRAAAEKKVDEHKNLMWEVGDLMHQWEMLQAEAEAEAVPTRG
ncbi:MAG: ABC-F family ATP-binding cassette domain-containing protein [Vicinamibacteria bacterium]|nr:ABC-F family ATP-binding cassette domain-containing protein [Vicinamibacteria bacterium]